MIARVFHPASIELLWLQSRGRRRRMWRRFCQPRRLALSALACVLAVAWLGNAAMTIWLRETGSPETLRALLSLGLVLYAGWHVAKAAFFQPEHPFDFTPEEHELLGALPLRPRDLVAHQLGAVTVTTFFKAALFTLLLWPDLHCVPLNFVGVLLAMMFLEILRMAIQIITWGMSRLALLAYRAAVVAGLVATGFAVGAAILHASSSGPLSAGAGIFHVPLGFVIQIHDSAFAYAALPFQPLVNLVLTHQATAAGAGLAVAATATAIALAAGLIGLYAATANRVAIREKRNYSVIRSTQSSGPSSEASKTRMRLRFIARLGGAGTLAWRQLLGARRQWGNLLTAMIAPAVLAAAPCLVIGDSFLALLCTIGTLAFYSFLLLPTALRYDFHRDLSRLALLKGLPVAPAATVIGQTLAPILIATVFQAGVLTFAVIARSLSVQYGLIALLVMIPLNVLVFALENLIFLLYPHRLQQEGLEVFLRTMLTFTGKGLLFTAGLGLMSAWGFASAAGTHALTAAMGTQANAYAIFISGMIAGTALLAALLLWALCRTYRKLDPAEDLPR
jgi:hypothetical protein